MSERHEAATRTVEAEAQEFCSCGTHKNLCVTGISLIYRFHGQPAWTVKCFECEEQFLIDDDGRDQLFGTGWRTQP